MQNKLQSNLNILINKSLVFHFVMYFLFVFFIPFLNKVVIFSIQGNGIQIYSRIILSFLTSSKFVFLSDVIIILIWKFFNKLFKFSIRNIILIYIYCKILLPIQSLIILLAINSSYAMLINIFPNIIIILMTMFTLIFFNCFRYERKIIRFFQIILILIMSLLTRPFFLIFY
jgi:hypothetical protein